MNKWPISGSGRELYEKARTMQKSGYPTADRYIYEYNQFAKACGYSVMMPRWLYRLLFWWR
jgi:hypothetical protein